MKGTETLFGTIRKIDETNEAEKQVMSVYEYFVFRIKIQVGKFDGN